MLLKSIEAAHETSGNHTVSGAWPGSGALAVSLLALSVMACSAGDTPRETSGQAGPSIGVGAGDPDPSGGGMDEELAAAEAISPLSYDNPLLWLCGADPEDDLCLTADLTATRVHADGSFTTVAHEALEEPEFDCFYVYPTVDLREEAGNTESVVDITAIAPAVVGQGAWFRSVCRVFAPLYRQMTIGTYYDSLGRGELYETTEPFAVAYSDVSAAFDHYMTYENSGRDIVLIGHSQGAHMLTRLLEDRFDHDEAMRSKLISGVLVGPVGRVVVPEGEVVGGNFDNLPLCQAETETGCVIAYDSEAAGLETPRPEEVFIPEGARRACTNPAALGGGQATLADIILSTYLPLPVPEEVDQAWVSYPDFHTAECGASGGLQINVIADDPREPPATPQALQANWEANGGGFALHNLDFVYSMGDLLRIVESQGASSSITR
jgi:hypothetical protein